MLKFCKSVNFFFLILSQYNVHMLFFTLFLSSIILQCFQGFHTFVIHLSEKIKNIIQLSYNLGPKGHTKSHTMSYNVIHFDLKNLVDTLKCGISSAIKTKMLSIPSSHFLLLAQTEVSFVFLGDDAFVLKPFMMKPYPQQNLTTDKWIYHYRQSCIRRISENLFWILENCWHIFLT